MHEADAAGQQLAEGDSVQVAWGGQSAKMNVHVNDTAPEGTAVLTGIPYQAGVFSAQISKEEVVAA